MIAQRDGPFLNLARLNVDKYARDKTVNRHLFDYVFMHEADMKMAQQASHRIKWTFFHMEKFN
jgi:tetratricopeptide repeat protein 8